MALGKYPWIPILTGKVPAARIFATYLRWKPFRTTFPPPQLRALWLGVDGPVDTVSKKRRRVRIQLSYGPKNPGSLTFHGKSWLVNRDPYSGLLYFLYKWVV